MGCPSEAGLAALHQIKSTDPPLWLSPNPSLAQSSRSASQYLFSSLAPFCPKSPFDSLLAQGFDAEQIWQQIDLQTQPLLSNLRRELNRFQQNPDKISSFFSGKISEKVVEEKGEGAAKGDGEKEGFADGDGENEGSEEFDEMEDEGSGSSSEEEEEEEEEEEGGHEDRGGVEDRFLKIKELEEYLEKDEAREYGLSEGKNENRATKDEENDEDDDDEIGEDGDGDGDEGVRYEDFFGGKKKKSLAKRIKSSQGSENLGTDAEQDDDAVFENQEDKETLSTHEKHLEKVRSKIEQMEKANLEPKTWTMQGEITASKRPKNSALEVDLDFEHNVRPAPVITEEVTASLEDLIKKRILEGHFDDVQKAPSLPSKAPRELKELDENKSKKGLAEIYEEEYVQKINLSTAPLSFTDEQKNEASLLFKKLCLKLDALSHFHFAPKPIIEDLSIQTNVPALAMEEIAPLSVSDAAMLAPEEVFAGKGDIKEEAELTQAERKRRRANKKRKFKGETAKRTTKKARDKTFMNHANGMEES